MKTILFVCAHNAGRSQMAEAFINHFAAERGLAVRGLSAGTEGGIEINPQAGAAMVELGISMTGQRPKILTQAMADNSDHIITMGCSVDADTCPARIHRSESWGLDGPQNTTLEQVRVVRDQIHARVRKLRIEVIAPIASQKESI